jgi:hypothetical protein
MSIKDRVQAKLFADHGTADRGQLGTGTIIAAFLLVVIGMALVFVLDIFDGSIGTPTDSSLSQSQDSMLAGFSSLSDLIEPIVVIAGVAVIIGVVRRVQS